ncbi:MAG: tetratricopeptide repeat protein [Ruminococcus sp.]|nr:tetratricopeptide repeat protein [Ruminococcus sp.]
MKTKIFFVLNIVIIAAAAGILVWQLFFAEERDMRLVSKAAVLLAVYLLAVLGIRRKRSPLDYMVYEEQYKEFLGSAFRNDRSSYRRLMSAITRYNENKYDKAIEILDKLYTSCAEPDDYSAVLFFKALCLDEQSKSAEAAECYEELLTYKRDHGIAWSNLGAVYQSLGKNEKALYALENSLSCKPDNAYAYNNIASIYIRTGETELALKNSLEAIRLNSKLYQAMGTAAMAYKMLGDNAGAEKYCNMYGANGGNSAKLKETLGRI